MVAIDEIRSMLVVAEEEGENEEGENEVSVRSITKRPLAERLKMRGL